MSNPPPIAVGAIPTPQLAKAPVRKNNMLFWILFGAAMCIMLGCAAVSFLGDIMENGLLAFVGLIVAMIPMPIYVSVFLWLDRFEPEPPQYLIAAFVWGAGIAGLFACILNTIFGTVAGQIINPDLADQLTASISAPLMEEGFKGMAVAILFFWLRSEFDGVIDGIIYAGITALGFATAENVSYYARGLNHGVVEFTLTFVIRGIMGPYAHVLFTSMTGIGFGISRPSKNTFLKFAAPFLGWMGAMALHCTWNTLPAIVDLVIPEGGLISYFIEFLILWVPLFAIFLGIIAFALRGESKLIRRHLSEPHPDSPVTLQDADAGARMLPRLTGNVKVLMTQGWQAWLAQRRYLHALTALAFYRERVEQGRVLANPELETEITQRIVANRPRGFPVG